MTPVNVKRGKHGGKPDVKAGTLHFHGMGSVGRQMRAHACGSIEAPTLAGARMHPRVDAGFPRFPRFTCEQRRGLRAGGCLPTCLPVAGVASHARALSHFPCLEKKMEGMQ